MGALNPRPWHRYSLGLLGPHRLTGEELAIPIDPTAPRFHRCDCTAVLGLRLGDFMGPDDPDAERVIWAPRRVLEAALRQTW